MATTAFVVLTTPPNCEGEDRGHAPFSLYSDYVRSLDLFQFTYAQSYSCPGLVLELSGIQVQNKCVCYVYNSVCVCIVCVCV